jgi:hypothetical protein
MYTNAIENDDFTIPSNLTLLKNFYLFPATELFSNFDEFVTSYKSIQNVTNSSLGTMSLASN